MLTFCFPGSLLFISISNVCIDSSLSRMMPRSQMESTGSLTTELNVKLMTSRRLSWERLALEPNLINSVLSGLSCSLWDEHQFFRFVTHVSSRLWCSITTSSRMWSSSCESSAYRWWLISNLLMVSTMSSVYSMNSWGPSTEPWGTPQVSYTGTDESIGVFNVCKRSEW